MSPKNFKHDPVQLYSSINFVDQSDSKIINNWKLDNKLKLLVKFISKFNNEYFKAIVSLDVYNHSGTIKKKNIVIKDICFKNVLNVSESSQTQEYEYLYEISCSSADNHDSCSSSSNSYDSMINKKTEKEIATNIKAFIASNAFEVSWSNGITTIKLDITQYVQQPQMTPVFESVKNIIKYKFIDYSSSCSSSSSSSSSCSDTDSCTYSSKPNKIFKILMITAVVTFVIILIMNIIKKNEYCLEYKSLYINGFNNGVTSVIGKVKGLVSKVKELYSKPLHLKEYSNDYTNINDVENVNESN
jgi:hypothetical protein